MRLIAEGLQRHGRVELCRVCRVRGSGEWLVVSDEGRLGEEMSWKSDSGRLKGGRAEGPGKRKGWRGIVAKLDGLLYRKGR